MTAITCIQIGYTNNLYNNYKKKEIIMINNHLLIAIDEELVRLRSHFLTFNDILNSSEPAGRKLDFLLQEMNRETNTIGSKCQNAAIAKIVVDVKCELEKIREQIQNIE